MSLLCNIVYIVQNSTDGQNDAIRNENVGHVENQQELSQSSTYSQNDINKDAASVSVNMQQSTSYPKHRYGFFSWTFKRAVK